MAVLTLGEYKKKKKQEEEQQQKVSNKKSSVMTLDEYKKQPGARLGRTDGSDIQYLPEESQKVIRLTEAKKKFDEKTNELDIATKRLDDIRTQNLKRAGVKTVQELLEEEKSERLPSYSFVKQGGSLSPYNSLNKKISENNAKYGQVNNAPEVVKERENVNKIVNDLIYSKYKYNVADVDNYKMSTMEKLLGAIPRAINDLGSAFSTDNTYIDENGKKMHLPTRDALLQQKASEDSSLPIKMLTDTLYNGTKILATEGLNLISGGMGGTALYFNDMFNDSYKNAYNKTGDTGKAFANGLAQTGLEFVTEKLLGGVSKSLTGGKASALENAISDKLYAKLGSKNLSKLAGSIGSEFTEEFVQEFAGNAIDLLTLGSESGYKDIKDAVFNEEVLKDALYSGMVGGLSGGFISGINMSTGLDRTSQKVQLVEEFKTQLEESRKNVTDKNTIDALDTAIDNVNKYLERPFTNLDNEQANEVLNRDINNFSNNILPTQQNTSKNSLDLPTIKNQNIDLQEISNSFSRKEQQTINRKLSISDDFTKEISNKTKENMKDKNSVIFVPINNLKESFTRGGNRDFQQISNMIDSIKEKGIQEPIKVNFEDKKITNGNHRLFVADKLGLKEVPVQLTNVSDSIDLDSNKWYNSLIKGNDYEKEASINSSNEESKNELSHYQRSNDFAENTRTSGKDDGIHKSIQGYNNRPSTKTVYSRNDVRELNDSSFSLPANQESKKATSKQETTIPTYKDFANEKVEQKVNKQGLEAIRKATNAGKSYLQLKQSEVKTLRNDLKEYLGLSKEQLTNAKTYNGIKDKIEQFMNKQVEYLDEDLKRVKKEVRNTKIKVDPSVREQITDYGEFRKQNFGKLRLTSDGQSIDSVYKELSELYPYYFDSSITSEADMLYELSDFMDKPNTIIEEYKLSDNDMKKATDKIFNSLIDNSLSNEDIETMQNDILKKYSKRTRKVVQAELLNDMGITVDDISVGKDISSLDLQRTDPIRVNEKVFGAKIGQKINDETINKTKHNEAERTRFLNKEREEIKELGIKPHSKESAAVQKYGEKQYINDKGELVKYTDRDLTNEFSDIATQDKIKKAAEILRNKYDTYIEQINNVITELGYDPIPKRPDYMRHFQEINDKLSQWGIPLNPTDLNKENIPTDINGLTDQFRPGKNWFASALQRKGFKTTYDAITGIDGYLEGASNLIYHTEDIQRYRTLSKFIRDTYGQTHGMDNVDIDTKEGQQRLNDIFDNKLSKYVAWLDEQANALAGKKGGIDRAAERFLGRKVYTILDTAKKQVGSNMTGFNVRSALTNFASVVQGASKTNKLAFIRGTLSTLGNMIHNDGLINKSDFLTSRFGSDQLSKKIWQKASNAGQIFMTGSDYFTANQIWRSKYYENLSKKMSESQAIKNADDFASRIMGDRSKGATAEIFNSKTLGLLTQFQLEVNNQWSSIVHDNKMDIKRGNKSGATVVFQLGQLAAMSYFFNNFMKSLTGSDVMIDPIDMFKKLLGGDDDDDEKTLEQRATEVFGDLINDLPFASFLTGGRIPMAEAFTGVGTAFKKLTNQKDKFGNDIKWDDVKKDLTESAYYWLLPTGYGQLKKTTKGLSMYDKKLPMAGSYTDKGNLRFRADESIGGKTKAALFGQYSSKEAKEYINSGYKAISKSNLDEIKELNMSTSEYRKYRSELNKSGTTIKDKINYIINSNYSNNQKNIMAKKVLGKEFDVKEYKKYDSYEEYAYATKEPMKYSLIKQITTYDKYTDYSNKIENLKKKYSTTSERKSAVANYVNSLKLSIPQKAMLIRSVYKSFTEYDAEIVNYINEQKLTSVEKSNILGQLGFTVKDGRVYY